jgi:hypothetical protein
MRAKRLQLCPLSYRIEAMLSTPSATVQSMRRVSCLARCLDTALVLVAAFHTQWAVQDDLGKQLLVSQGVTGR